jgi:hypothetical protein
MVNLGSAAAADPTDRTAEESLVRQAIEGDAEAFGRLYSLYLNTIYKYLHHWQGRSTVAEGLTEKVFLIVGGAEAGPYPEVC